MAPLCKFWQQGTCRNGANCRFEHPGSTAVSSTPFGAPNANRFNALNTTSTRPQDETNPYKITKESIRLDLENERPAWILSCYGPGKEAPEQLFGGYPREQSLEEVMVHIKGSANPQQAIQEVTALHNQAEQQIQTTLRNLDGALQFVLAGANNHPNRIDICKQNTMAGGTTGIFAVKTGFADNPLTSNTGTNQNPFSSTTQSNPFSGGGGGGGGVGGGGGTPAFGQPSTLGRPANPFGAASTPQFGQPSQMGAAAPAGPAFGQPSQMGASAPAFGKPSTLGQGLSPFAAAAGPSPFSQAGQSAPTQPSPFAAAASSSTGPTNPFGQPSGTLSGASPFAQVSSAPAPTTLTTSPFGQPAVSNPFAQSATSKDLSMDTSVSEPATNNPFGRASSLGPGSNTQPNNPFGQPSSNSAPSTMVASGFSQAAPQNQQPQTHPLQPPASTAEKPGPYAPGSTKQHPAVESYMTKAMNGQITAFKNQPVIYKWKVNDRYQDQPPPNPSMDQQVPGYRKPDGTWCKILFPDGPPVYNKDSEPDAGLYDATVKAVYEQMAATGRFQGGMPEVPPMREDCIWSF
ncbi:hypothetical protein F5Y09DRAFT_343781 [Xylaria sp. FL1042]|nr:hypothetical protein F5Y09DRAFT_343781 [Xylaria sp. FL1042]